jgi:type I restriction enzyme S subunit
MIADEWIRESMPTHWGIARVKDHALVVNGYRFDSKLFATDAVYPLVRIRDISSSETVVRYDGDWIPEAAITTGDVLVGMDGDFNVARWNGGDALLNQRVCCIRTAESMDSGYLYYALPKPLQLINEFTYSTTVKHLSSFDVLDIRVPFPPIDQQKLIANYLDRETARIDGLVSEKERMLALLEEKRAALISRVVTRGLDPNAPIKPSGQEWLGDIPAHWRIRRIKYLTTALDQGSSPIAANSPAGPDELEVLKLGTVSRGRFRREENKALRDADDSEQATALRKGDVLITRGNTPQLVADVACVPEDEPNLLIPDLIYRLRVRNEEILPEFLTAFLTSAPARTPIRRDARGSSGSMVKVSQDHVLNWQAPLPPLPEQAEIVAHLQAAEARFQSVSTELAASVSLLAERRAALITAAVTGQIPLSEMQSETQETSCVSTA